MFPSDDREDVILAPNGIYQHRIETHTQKMLRKTGPSRIKERVIGTKIQCDALLLLAVANLLE